MEISVSRDKRVGFATNTKHFEKAKAVAKANGLTISSAMDVFEKQVAITGKMALLGDEKEILFLQVQSQVKQAIDNYSNGVNTYSVGHLEKLRFCIKSCRRNLDKSMFEFLRV
ncbi:hypothetical protein [Streptococcus sp. NLN76]|uniref:hypothetical protein n=1 Tax=Streptococcus sp. NLN76 TaxID=2822800 RepID=UPI0018ABB711|nr:hypothetical protein [Streptococcus sp. NLN76]MBF8970845.1 hypothetical protein [Streptococcus sp. NLN76]